MPDYRGINPARVRLGIVVKEACQSDDDIAEDQESGPEERQYARQPDGPWMPYPGRGCDFHIRSVHQRHRKRDAHVGACATVIRVPSEPRRAQVAMDRTRSHGTSQLTAST